MARAGSLKDVCVSSQLGVFFGWVFFLEGGLGYTRHSGVTYAVVVGFARTGERGGEGAVGHQGCAQKTGRPVVCSRGLSVYRCVAAGIRQRTTACERCSVLRTRPNLSYPPPPWRALLGRSLFPTHLVPWRQCLSAHSPRAHGPPPTQPQPTTTTV